MFHPHQNHRIMKPLLYAVALLLLTTSCGNNKPKKKGIANVVEKVNYNVAPRHSGSAENITLNLPVIGKINLSEMKKDSINHYSFENCQGKVTQYSTGNSIVVTDSLSCGDEAHIYTFYVLDKEKKIRYVDVQKLSMSLIPGQKVYWYVLSEKVYDFSSSPAKLSFRSDTTEIIPTKPLDKTLTTKMVEDSENRLNLWKMKFDGLWRLK